MTVQYQVPTSHNVTVLTIYQSLQSKVYLQQRQTTLVLNPAPQITQCHRKGNLGEKITFTQVNCSKA